MKNFLLLFSIFIVNLAFAQGDDCSNAVQLTNLANYCSTNGTYSNATATVGAFGVPTCWYPTGSSAPKTDVWFKFIAIGSDVLFTVNGKNNSTNAALENPNIALYEGDCSGTIIELKCETNYKDYIYSNNVTLYKGGLKLGNTYLVRISTSQADIGKFDICVNNFTPVPNPDDPNDCNRATIICNKDATSVGKLNAAGNDATEVDNLGCFATASAGESNSTWLHFTCKTPGSLKFEINGAVPTDDIDWILMEIPGIRNCATKTVLSCNLSNCDINRQNSSTTTPRKTGIRDGEDAATLNGTYATPDSELGGCGYNSTTGLTGKQNGFNQTVQIQEGHHYALFLNNFEGSSGYTVTWGGTSTFVGPESKITVDKNTICVGESVTVNGTSSEAFTSFKWDLPSEAMPQTQTSIDNFTQTFNSTGTFPIILTTYDDNGCLNVKNTLITVNGINMDFTAPSVCSGNATTFSSTTAATSLSWDFGDDSSNGTGNTTSHTYANPGDYLVKLTGTGGNGAGGTPCRNTFSQYVSVLGTKLAITPDPAVTCPGNAINLTGTAEVTGNASVSKVFNSTGAAQPIPKYYNYGTAPSSWDGTTGSGINSASSAATMNISNVTGLNPLNWKINSITIKSTTTNLNKLTLYVENPCGKRIRVINNPTTTTGTGATIGLNSTKFSPSASTFVTGATPIGVGPFKPSDFSLWNTTLLNCTNPNGTWKLIGAIDENTYLPSSNPTIDSWSIDFQSDIPNTIKSLTWNPSSTSDQITINNTQGSTLKSVTTNTNTQFTLTAVDQNNCTTSKQINVTVSTPASPTCNGTSICSGATANLSANLVTNAIYKWYDAISGNPIQTGTISNPGNSFDTPNLTATRSYWVTQTINGCESAKTEVVVTVTSCSCLNTTTGPESGTTCINTILPNLIHRTTIATGISNSGISGANGLPSGVSATWANNIITISGTPTASGSFNYSIPLTGGCGSVNATGTITVTAENTAGAASSTPTLCINSALTNITHATTGAIGISNSGVSGANGLPSGVSATWSSNTITISGTPTSSGTFNYTIPLLGCGSASATGTIIVTPLNTTTGPLTGSSCINSPLNVLSHNTTGAIGISNNGVSGANGLPSGVSATWASNIITIIGTPTVSGSFNYSIPLTGGCGNVNATGTITVNPISSATLFSAPGTDAQGVCVNSPLTQISYTTTGVTSIGAPSNLPNGVTARFSGDVNSGTILITGTPTETGLKNYTIPLIAGCGTPNIIGSITTKALPVANPTANTPCEQDILKLDAGFTGANSYSWEGPNGFTSNIEKPTINNVTLNARGNYTLNITDNNNCSNTFTLSGVVINPVDNIQFIDIKPTCKNGSVFNLPVVNIPGGTWTSDDNISIQNPSIGIFDPTKSLPDQNYKVVVTYSTKTISNPPRLCPSTLSKVVFVYPTPDTTFMVNEKLLCITDTLIAEVLNPQPNTTYTWDFNNGQTFTGSKTNYTYPKSGTFDLTITAKQGICTNTSTRSQYIKVIDLPENVEFTQSETKIDFYDLEVQFQTKTTANYYLWNFGDGTTSTYKNPKHKFPEIPGKYIIDLTVSNMIGKCGLTVSSSIFIPEPVIYFIPNTFTPNGDEINNTFQPVFTYGYDPQNYSFYVYNRWGELIFESHDTKIGWDGTFGDDLVQNDTYIWKLEFKEKIEEYKHVETGHVNVLR